MMPRMQLRRQERILAIDAAVSEGCADQILPVPFPCLLKNDAQPLATSHVLL